ncbi:tetratricopeptide repeat protein [Brevundimonas sp.]|uniref:tetratricopeptide repeat protein n=1 Tax=Brevundimonas sp. TaxID=1871086 RepID=UPI002D3BB8E5|nr:tetratricopeptide repeat protein [Brevundimonas sp.]HYC97417.1 tetratricopeptide repeat protein [Brevundimonas sp.]
MVGRLFVALAALLAMLASTASAQEVELAPAPAWVMAPPADPPTPAAGDAALRTLAIDHQIRFDAEGTHTYVFQRFQVLTRQGLSSVGTVSLVWSPPRETIQVHALRLIRDGQTIDVLASQQFETLRRESNLESAMLDGSLTATLQPRDIRVGDILELAFTSHDTHGVLAPHLESFDGAGGGEAIDRYRLRASWSEDHPMRVMASAPWADVRPRRVGRDWVYEIDARTLAPERMPDDLPVRFTLSRSVQFTDFGSWADASRVMAPLYEQGATLEPDSPLLAEIERIRAGHDTDAARAAAALRLVEDQVRYLALSMGEGNYVPASADEVWRSRYGDCKGKTVLLLALLKGLGIEAEAVLVSTGWGDGLDVQLPLLAWFDHVIVRATVDGKAYWMDGTRIGDRTLDGLVPEAYRWGLPVRAAGAVLEAVEQPPLTVPSMEVVAELDARAGLDADAGMSIDIIYRGDHATAVRRQLGSIPPDQLETMFKSQWDSDEAGMTIDAVETRYDEPANELHLIMRGTTRMSWVDGSGGRVMAFPDSAIVLPSREERKGVLAQFKDHPYAIDHPAMSRAVYRVILPHGGRGFQLEGGDQTLEGGGYRIERRGTLANGVAELAVSTTSLTSEVTAEEMASTRTRAENASALPLRLRAPADYAPTSGDAARRQPGSSDTADLIARAGRLSEAGDHDGALALLGAAIEREPGNAEALRARGQARLAARDYDGARADYDRAVDLDPADHAAAAGQGVAALGQGRYDEAVVALSVALRLDPADVRALSARGAAYYQLGRSDRSLADYRALKTTLPDNPTGAFGELRALIRLDRGDEARTLIASRLADDPTDGIALDALVRLEKRAGRPADALPALDRALEAAPGAANLLSLRGQIRASVDDMAGARSDFAAMRDMDPGDPVMLNNVCWAQALEAFDLDQALADCDGALSAGEAAFIDSRAMVLLQMGRYDEARIDYERALAAAPDQTPSIYGLGLARLALGDAGGSEDLARARARNIDVAEDFTVFEARHPDLVK